MAARDHCQDMARQNFFSHVSKIEGKRTFADRARRMKTTAVGENLASSRDPSIVVSLWMASSGHRRNILNPQAVRIGIGIIGHRYTLLIGE